MISADTFWKSGIQSPIGEQKSTKHSELCGMCNFLPHSAGLRAFFIIFAEIKFLEI